MPGVLLYLYSFLFPNTAYALDFAQSLNNLSRTIAPLTAMVLVVSFVIGIGMIFGALIKMKKFGQIATYSTAPGEIGGPLVSLIVGAVLIYLPTTSDTLMNSIFSIGGSGFDYSAYGKGADLLTYGSLGGLEQQMTALANTLVLIIQFLGLLSFIKGWIIVAKSATPQGGQQNSFTKGLTHIIGGIILINFMGAVNIISNTLNGTS